MARVVVVGGGVSGLAAAHRLRELSPGVEIILLEAGDRLGGLIRTEHTDGYLIERGPESFITTKPAALELIERVGLTHQLIGTNDHGRGAYVVCRGEMVPIPKGFSVVAPARLMPLVRSPLLSWRGKARALLEPWIPGKPARGDESLASFVGRRYGREVLERLSQPLAGGIYGADPALLSLRSTMPRFLDLEAKYGSVTRGLRARAALDGPTAGARYTLFLSLRAGMQSLVEALERRLEGAVRLGVAAEGIAPRSGEGWEVRTDTDTIEADAVILATPAPVTARLMQEVSPPVSQALDDIEYGSSAAVTLAWPRSAVSHPLDAFGFLVPAIEGSPVMASTWSSIKWPGRAPESKVLLRVFLGGYHLPEVPTWSDSALVAAARHGLGRWVGVWGEPELVRVDRYLESMPRYLVGHADRIAEVQRDVARITGLEVAGNAYAGVGIPDSIRSGEEAALRTLDALGVMRPRDVH